jgi:hypothetical protein
LIHVLYFVVIWGFREENMLKIFSYLAFQAFLVISFTSSVFAQANSKPIVLSDNDSGLCEYTAVTIDVFVQKTDVDDNIIIVSYEGKNESREDVALQRLLDVENYIANYYLKTPYARSAEKIIGALGKNKTEKGRLDFYVKGKLTLTILFRDNREVLLSPCVRDK